MPKVSALSQGNSEIIPQRFSQLIKEKGKIEGGNNRDYVYYNPELFLIHYQPRIFLRLGYD